MFHLINNVIFLFDPTESCSRAMFLLVLGLGCAFVCGVFASLVLQWHFFLNYLMKLPAVPPFPNEEYARPRAAKVHSHVIWCVLAARNEFWCVLQAVRDEIRREPLPSRQTHYAFNLILNAVFSQIRFMPGIRNWILKKIRFEIDEMLTKTTAGHLLTAVRVSFDPIFLSHSLLCLLTFQVFTFSDPEPGGWT